MRCWRTSLAGCCARSDVLVANPPAVHVVFRETATLGADAIAAAVAVLSDEELAQYRRFHFAEDARDYALAHALLRTVLSRDGAHAPREWQFGKTPEGKPFVRDADAGGVSFSLSHTRGMVACAVTRDADIGIDVERINRDVNAGGIAVRFFAPVEAAALGNLAPEVRTGRFFDLWTLKEALVKALGLGLSFPLDRVAFDVDALAAGPTIAFSGPADIPALQWQFELFTPAPAFRGAVAIRRRSGPPLQVTIRPSTGQA
jgi:4'-phosphopantetheinyl transferase